jgi:histone H3/H4
MVTCTRRRRQGDNALWEIRRYQNSVHNLIPKQPFARVLREVMPETREGGAFRMQSVAIEAFQEAAEAQVIKIFEAANLVS